ncbi:MAG: phosphohydrolase [Candidatus Omnitrophica bacterium CG23_combo_of_CG06-09_8_20_14_all_40_11]|nr:MAG: phosphohydrolase [Candidatus Omnitrophica bacterium CG23_combo_of_CG06-09_8_20_14_all_40_11]
MRLKQPACIVKLLFSARKAKAALTSVGMPRDVWGLKVYSKYMRNKVITTKQKLLKELEEYFGSDIKRINHAKNVMHFAEELLKQEKADWYIVIPASILHDMGIKVAEEKYGSSAGHFQEKEGPEIARIILLKVGFKKEDIDEICEIIAQHHTPGKINTQNFKVLYDADWLVNLKDEVDSKDKEKTAALLNKIFLTQAGKDLAEKIYL